MPPGLPNTEEQYPPDTRAAAEPEEPDGTDAPPSARESEDDWPAPNDSLSEELRIARERYQKLGVDFTSDIDPGEYPPLKPADTILFPWENGNPNDYPDHELPAHPTADEVFRALVQMGLRLKPPEQ